VNDPVCKHCHDEMPGATHAERVEDARHIGWVFTPRHGWICDNCIAEMESL
jgi:hypothetical protein